jgi:hypothetical protein
MREKKHFEEFCIVCIWVPEFSCLLGAYANKFNLTRNASGRKVTQAEEERRREKVENNRR